MIEMLFYTKVRTRNQQPWVEVRYSDSHIKSWQCAQSRCVTPPELSKVTFSYGNTAQTWQNLMNSDDNEQKLHPLCTEKLKKCNSGCGSFPCTPSACATRTPERRSWPGLLSLWCQWSPSPPELAKIFPCLEMLNTGKEKKEWPLSCKVSCIFFLCTPSRAQPKWWSHASLWQRSWQDNLSHHGTSSHSLLLAWLFACLFCSYHLIVSQSYCAFMYTCSSTPWGFAVLADMGTGGFPPHFYSSLPPSTTSLSHRDSHCSYLHAFSQIKLCSGPSGFWLWNIAQGLLKQKGRYSISVVTSLEPLWGCTRTPLGKACFRGKHHLLFTCYHKEKSQTKISSP